MQRMYSSSVVRPNDPSAFITLDHEAPNDVITLIVGPVIFKLPERMGGRGELYIAIKGWITFEGPDFRTTLKTKSFGTKIGYFRSKPGSLDHVYGAHYDMDEVTGGHPVFHAQLAPMMDLGDQVKALFKLDDEIANSVKPLLRNVRTPTAQMDVFSVLTQICADHLIPKDAGAEVKRAFVQIRKSNQFFTGAAHRLTYLRRTASRTAQDALFEHPRRQPFVDHLPDDAVRDSLVEERSELMV